MTTFLLTALAAPLAISGAAFFYSRMNDTQSRTVPEALIRWLYLIARWFQALAEASDSSVMVYREHLRLTDVQPDCELYHEVKA